jgi:hypothetical protein
MRSAAGTSAVRRTRPPRSQAQLAHQIGALERAILQQLRGGPARTEALVSAARAKGLVGARGVSSEHVDRALARLRERGAVAFHRASGWSLPAYRPGRAQAGTEARP